MNVIADDLRVKPFLEEMSAPTVANIERLRVPSVERMHPARHRFTLAQDDEVEVVRHQAEGEHAPVSPGRRESQKPHEATTVELVGLDGAAGDSATRDMKDAEVREVGASSPRHAPNVPRLALYRIGPFRHVSA